jgi:hypothetical protein
VARQSFYAVILAAMLASCVSTGGGDPVVVNAEKTTQIALDSFDSFLKYEYENRAALESVSPAIHQYANYVRANGQKWLQSARSLTQAYKYNRSETNKANLDTAIAVLLEAVKQVGIYMKSGTLGAGSPSSRLDKIDPAILSAIDRKLPIVTTGHQIFLASSESPGALRFVERN